MGRIISPDSGAEAPCCKEGADIGTVDLACTDGVVSVTTGACTECGNGGAKCAKLRQCFAINPALAQRD